MSTVVDRSFLDLFWAISGEDKIKSSKACDTLLSRIKYKQKLEEASLKHAYLLSPRLLCESGRIRELDIGSLVRITQFVFPLFELHGWRSQVLSVCCLMVSDLSPKSIRKVFGAFVERVKDSFFACDSENTSEELLFLISTQKHVKIAGDRQINLTSTHIRRKIVTAISHSSSESVLRLMDRAVEENAFQKLWPRILRKLNTSKTKQKSYRLLLQLTSHMISSHGDDLTRFVLSETVVRFIMFQLSSPHLACFSDADSAMKQCLKDVVQSWNLQIRNKSSGEEKRRTITPASPETVFSCFTAGYPLCDLLCASGALKPCRFLLERASRGLSAPALTSYARKLMNAFHRPISLTPETDERTIRLPKPHVLRRLIASQLLAVLNCAFDQTSSDPHSELVNSILKFYLTMGLAGSLIPLESRKIEPEISPDDSRACYLALFRFLSKCSDATHYSEHSPRRNLSQLLQYVLSIVNRKLDPPPEEGHQITLYLPYVQKSLSLLQDRGSHNDFGCHLANLHAAGCLFSFAQGNSDSSSIMGLLDDLSEALEKSRTQKPSDSPDGPPWTAVLSDVILGFMALASNLLRSCARAAFEQMIIVGAVDPVSLNLILDVMRTRLEEPVDLTHESEITEDKLITFDADPLDDSEPDGDNNQHSADETESDEDTLEIKQAPASDASSEEEFGSPHQTMDDAEMFANDEALAAAFRANRIVMPKRMAAERARALCETKMRCLDLLECVIQHTSQPNLLVPALVQLIKLGSKALKGKRVSNSDSKKHEKASLVARWGDLPPFECIVNAICRVRTRTPSARQALLKALTESSETSDQLLSILDAALSIAAVAHPPPQLVTMLTAITQFLFQLADSVATAHPDLSETLLQPLVREFSVFISSARKCKTHRTVLLSLLKSCPSFSNYIAPLLAKSFLQIMEPNSRDDAKLNGSSSTKSAIHYTYIQRCESVAAICGTLVKGDTSSGALIRFHDELLFEVLTKLNNTSLENPGSIEWLNSVALTTAFLTAITQLVKAAKKIGSVPVIDPSVPQNLCQLPLPKPIRRVLRKFANFLLTTMHETGQNTGLSKAERKRRKKEACRDKRIKAEDTEAAERLKTTSNGTVNSTVNNVVSVPHRKKTGTKKTKKKPKGTSRVESKKRQFVAKKENEDETCAPSSKKRKINPGSN
ncbi:unnamed protein product [Dicrocoelium dendriticum]|nr:unnamed protein product [Dicrocoelium dendriticum]